MAKKCDRENLRKWAIAIQIDAQRETPPDEYRSIYSRKWFGFGGYEELGVNRAGYCVGYHLAITALGKYSAGELILLNGAEIEPIVRDILSTMAQDPENDILNNQGFTAMKRAQ